LPEDEHKLGDPLGFFGPYLALVFGFHLAMLPAHKAGSMGEFGWRLAVESHMSATLIVVPAPGFDNRFGLLHCFKPVQIQALIAERPVEAFDMAVVGRFAWPTEIDSCLVMICP
jgi:hypothetical protein